MFFYTIEIRFVFGLTQIISIFLLFPNHIDGQDFDCDYYQNVSAGQSYNIYSKNYPHTYPTFKTCRWQAQCPTNFKCRLNCPVINIRRTTGCREDRFLVSKVGDPILKGANEYCGKGSMDILSHSNKLSIGFISSHIYYRGGRFACVVTAHRGSGSGILPIGSEFGVGPGFGTESGIGSASVSSYGAGNGSNFGPAFGTESKFAIGTESSIGFEPGFKPGSRPKPIFGNKPKPESSPKPETKPIIPSGTDCRCGWKKRTRIVGGAEAEVNEYPMAVGLIDIRLGMIFCGGTIIHKQWVLTSAYCLEIQKITNLAVIVGEPDNTKDSSPTQVIRASKSIIHSSFKGDYDYDIGLIKTEVEIVFNDNVGPACLPIKFSGKFFGGANVDVLGWGSKSIAEPGSDYLQKVTLQIADLNTCARTMGISGTMRTICTVSNGKDDCKLNSGGPLLYQEPSSERVYVVGIVVEGYGCATRRLGMNSRVSEYIDWIIGNTPSAEYCNK